MGFVEFSTYISNYMFLRKNPISFELVFFLLKVKLIGIYNMVELFVTETLLCFSLLIKRTMMIFFVKRIHAVSFFKIIIVVLITIGVLISTSFEQNICLLLIWCIYSLLFILNYAWLLH